jgi:hypothetical protein
MKFADVQERRRWRAALVTLCALVFLFAWHAKLAVYRGNHVKATAATSSKLWLDGQKLVLPSIQSHSGVALWAALSSLPLLARNDFRVHNSLLPPSAVNLTQHHLPCFFRPPPIHV